MKFGYKCYLHMSLSRIGSTIKNIEYIIQLCINYENNATKLNNFNNEFSPVLCTYFSLMMKVYQSSLV